MLNISALNKRERVLLNVVLFLIVFSVYMKFVYQPTLRSFRNFKKENWDLKNELSNLSFQFADLNTERRLLEQEKSRHDVLKKELDEYETKLYSQAQLGSLLRKVTQSAATYKLDFISITPQKKETEEFYLRFPVEIKLSSPYSGFLDYLRELEQISEVLKIRTIKIELDRAVSENPVVLLELSTVLSDRPVSPGESKIVSLPSEIVKLFTPEKPADSVSTVKLEGVELNGIIWKGGEPSAIINNQVVRLGSSIGKKKIIEINPDAVILQEGDIKYTLKMKP